MAQTFRPAKNATFERNLSTGYRGWAVRSPPELAAPLVSPDEPELGAEPPLDPLDALESVLPCTYPRPFTTCPCVDESLSGGLIKTIAGWVARYHPP